MKPGFIAIRNIRANIIAREHFRSPHAIVATINTLVPVSDMPPIASQNAKNKVNFFITVS